MERVGRSSIVNLFFGSAEICRPWEWAVEDESKRGPGETSRRVVFPLGVLRLAGLGGAGVDTKPDSWGGGSSRAVSSGGSLPVGRRYLCHFARTIPLERLAARSADVRWGSLPGGAESAGDRFGRGPARRFLSASRGWHSGGAEGPASSFAARDRGCGEGRRAGGQAGVALRRRSGANGPARLWSAVAELAKGEGRKDQRLGGPGFGRCLDQPKRADGARGVEFPSLRHGVGESVARRGDAKLGGDIPVQPRRAGDLRGDGGGRGRGGRDRAPGAGSEADPADERSARLSLCADGVGPRPRRGGRSGAEQRLGASDGER